MPAISNNAKTSTGIEKRLGISRATQCLLRSATRYVADVYVTVGNPHDGSEERR